VDDTDSTIDPQLPADPGFDAFSLSCATREALTEAGFSLPLPVQRAAFEPLRAGRDALIQAATGTGKTLAYGLPLIDGLTSVGQGPTFLVLAPTRELAMQVSGELGRVGGKGGLRTVLVYGGVGVEPQLGALRDGVHGIVGTPGRVLDVFDRMPKCTSALRVLVLDEADQLLSMGFEQDIEAIVQRFPGRYQGIFVSATLPPDIIRLAERFLRDPALISLAEEGRTPSEIRHVMFLIDPTNRLRDLVRILEAERPESSFIFCNTRDDAQILAGHLRERGFPVELLSGELSQTERDRVMNAVREGKVAHLVATDLAARGLDVLHLTHVIHFQFPQSPEGYVHRSGRVGRIGQPGTSIALVGPQDVAALYMLRLTYGIRPLERHLPSDEELARERETELVRGLIERHGGRPADPQSLALLRRLRTHVQGDAVLAAILREHLAPDALREEARQADVRARREAQLQQPRPSSRPPSSSAPPPRPSAPPPPPPPRPVEPKPSPAAPVRREEPKAPVAVAVAPRVVEQREPEVQSAPTEDERSSRRRRPRRDAGPGDGAAPGPEDAAPALRADVSPEPEPMEPPPGRSVTGKELRHVVLNVGVGDGVDGDFLGQWLQGRLALRASDFGAVRVRDRSTWIAVPADRVADAIGALNGLRFGGREVVAEEARRR
jgi:ATP-dependent RNA helicase DeaD